ncbi:MAG: hypothetical protein NDJ89_03755 [Oligoflexia bacterium]|nr:hypothetical protein [Oligoflexia bacterium]
MSKWKPRWAARIAKIEKFVDQIWYLPLLGGLAAADLFLIFIPTDGFLVTTAMLRPRKWVFASLWAALGSAAGSAAFAWVFATIGHGAFSDNGWVRSTAFVEEHGAWALALVTLGPIPINVGVLAAAILDMPPAVVFASVFCGRLGRYLFLAWAATHAPRLLTRLTGVRSEVSGILEAEEKPGVAGVAGDASSPAGHR